MDSNFTRNELYSGVVVAYENADLIADQALPRVGVASPEYKKQKFSKSDVLRIPDTLVGTRGAVNRVRWSATQTSGACLDFALEGATSQMDIEKAKATPNIDPRAETVMVTTHQHALAREKRVADLLANTANFGTVQTLDYTQQFDNPDSDVLRFLRSIILGAFTQPDTGVMGLDAWLELSVHPDLVAMSYKNEGTKGVVTTDFVAQAIGLRRLLIGQAWYENTNEGAATITQSRLWGNNLALYRLGANPGPGRGPCFGYTAEFGTKESLEYFDPKEGAKGSMVDRVVDCLDETVVATDMGILLQGVIASAA